MSQQDGMLWLDRMALSMCQHGCLQSNMVSQSKQIHNKLITNHNRRFGYEKGRKYVTVSLPAKTRLVRRRTSMRISKSS